MTTDRVIELLRGMQSSILNGGRLRSAAHVLDDSRIQAMDVAIGAVSDLAKLAQYRPQHHEECAKVSWRDHTPSGQCTCGLAAILATLPPPEAK